MGAEARLFREALGVLVDFVRDEEEEDGEGALWKSGIPAFDTLQRGQKLAMLVEVGTALLHEEEAMPKLTAVREAAVAVVYQVIREMVQLERDDPEAAGDTPTWRQLVLDACREREVADELPGPGCNDFDEWDILIQCLADGVLWDDDWLDAEQHLDADPETSQAIKQAFGIYDDYYVAVPPDPSQKQLEGVLAALAELLRTSQQGGETDDMPNDG